MALRSRKGKWIVLNFYGTRFAVGHKCYVLEIGAGGMWKVLPEQIVIEQVLIATYHKSNFALVTYVCSDGIERKEGMSKDGEPLTDVLYGSIIEAKSACAARNKVTFS